jgi:hypothetical protein
MNMMKILGTTAAVAALALTATPAFAAPTSPDKQATATARIIKPLTLVWVDDLDLGSITLVDAGPTTVGITRAGVFSCPGTAVTCSGTPKVAKYKITGVNNQVVTVNSANVSLTGPAGSTPLLLTVDAPASVNLGNSGTAGTNFSIGGSISVAGTQADGTYTGTFAVTVEY